MYAGNMEVTYQFFAENVKIKRTSEDVLIIMAPQTGLGLMKY